jgi:hypothetical protein
MLVFPSPVIFTFPTFTFIKGARKKIYDCVGDTLKKYCPHLLENTTKCLKVTLLGIWNTLYTGTRKYPSKPQDRNASTIL